jgi:hypothetical protein
LADNEPVTFRAVDVRIPVVARDTTETLSKSKRSLAVSRRALVEPERTLAEPK